MNVEASGEERARVHVFLSGHVQGVGMRMTVQRLAEDAHVRGWVRNLADGRVEFVAEGAKRALNSMLTALKRSRADYIRELTESWQEPQNEDPGFKILS